MRGSFLARGAASLDKIAANIRVKEDNSGGAGGRRGGTFVFSALSPPKEKGDSGEAGAGEMAVNRKGKVKQPPAKKARVSRTLDSESKKDTIFNLL